MLLSKTVEIQWRPIYKKYYIDLGYQYTKMGDTFEVKVEDLTPKSGVYITAQCDYCNRVYTTQWNTYQKHKDNISKDACGNMSCIQAKAHESFKEKYGVDSIHKVPELAEKSKQTCLKKYGAEYSILNEEVKLKIRNTLIKKNGCYRSQEMIQKSKNTCLERYGVEHYAQTLEYRMLRAQHRSRYEVNNSQPERKIPEYKDWRRLVFKRDDYTCQCCGMRSGQLNAHHVLDYKNHEDKRLDIDNGITLCVNCHKQFHSIYGKNGNDKQQLDKYILNHKTIIRMKRYAELMGIKPLEL